MDVRAVSQLSRPAPRPTDVGGLFQLLRDGLPRTRADLALLTGQARSTVAARVDLLLASGLVAPAGEASSTGGRPPATFAFSPSARILLAVDLGATHARLAVTDLASTVLAEHHEALAIAATRSRTASGPSAIASASWCSASTVEARSVTARRAPTRAATVERACPVSSERSARVRGRPLRSSWNSPPTSVGRGAGLLS